MAPNVAESSLKKSAVNLSGPGAECDFIDSIARSNSAAVRSSSSFSASSRFNNLRSMVFNMCSCPSKSTATSAVSDTKRGSPNRPPQCF
ncbi:unnamed protein product [Phytophthora lilii]|uniref:Unnamed protein product n=1 Tax=Phytophthora lilii TaxID=2077276 RepID=A0A9W7CQS3_9STRA|nr:unnamed protein product [Phytophthora lilii]